MFKNNKANAGKAESRHGRRRSVAAILGLGSAFLALPLGCTIESVDGPATASEGGPAGQAESGDAPAVAGTSEKPLRIQVNGSSTVYRVSLAVNEKFEELLPGTKVQAKSTGTGTGFQEMIAGDIDIANASRPIKPSELAACAKNGIQLVELKICLDGLTVCVNRENTWCQSLTVAQLKKIWEPGSTVKTWKDVDPSWPAEPIRLFGPGDESGTFDFFTEVINGKEDEIVEGYEASADDNVTVTGIAGEKGGLGFFGCAYYFANSDKVRALKISATDNPADGVEPTVESVRSGQYTPLSRPLFIYIRKSALARQEVQEYARYMLGDGQPLVSEVGYVPLDDAQLKESRETLESAISK